MTKQNVIVSDTGDITKSTINMAITLTLSSKSLFTYAPMLSSPTQKLPSGGFITLSRKKLWEKDDPVKASSTTHIKSPVFFSAVAEDQSSWIVSVQNLHMYNSIVSYGLIKLESFNKIVMKQWQFHHPSALKKFDQITNASKGKQIVMFLDYDGTLSPIVDDPDRAFMSDQVRITKSFIPISVLFPVPLFLLLLLLLHLALYFHGTDIRNLWKKKNPDEKGC